MQKISGRCAFTKRAIVFLRGGGKSHERVLADMHKLFRKEKYPGGTSKTIRGQGRL